jgi:hypothetical protein
MLQHFEIQMIGPGFYLVMAIMHEGPPVQVGLFDSKEEIDRACDLFAEQFKRKLN